MRGISWIQIPTSLLAMVDSSVGGKTAVDFAHFKNIVGSFWQPLEVFANVKVLNTLPDDWLRDGLGEVLKYCLLDAGFTLDDIIRSIDSNDFLDIVKKCIKLKAYVVKNDEYDTTGVRAYLNLGHTFGHAIERTSRFKISHGIAVMLGIIAVYKFKGSSKKELEEIKSVIAKILGSEKIASLCKIISKLNVTRIVDAMALDKKLLSSEKLEIILPGSQFLLKCSKVTIPIIDVEDKFIKPALEEIMLWS
jgi:3-dehydroquinate synthase